MTSIEQVDDIGEIGVDEAVKIARETGITFGANGSVAERFQFGAKLLAELTKRRLTFPRDMEIQDFVSGVLKKLKEN